MMCRFIFTLCFTTLLMVDHCVEAGRGGKKRSKLKDNAIARQKAVDPVNSWMTFVRQSARRNNRPERPKSDRRGRRVFHGPAGPRGPPGPPGPPGSPGAVITEAAMLAQFRNLVRDTADRRVARFAGQPLGLMAAGVPDVISAFFIVQQNDIVIIKRSVREIANYQVKGAGTFIRGTGVQLKTGRFVAPYTAIYRFQATLHIGRAKDASLKPRDAVSAMICINSDCEKSVALKYRSGLSSNARMFTVTVDGLLYLMANQYTSIILENPSGNTITVAADSTFSGYLVGA